MASAFYKVLDPTIKYPTWFVFQNPQGDNGNEFYGFPEVSWNYPGYIRVASDFVIKPLDSPGSAHLHSKSTGIRLYRRLGPPAHVGPRRNAGFHVYLPGCAQ